MLYAAIRLLRGNVIAYYSICLWTISGAVSNMSLVRDAAFAGKKKPCQRQGCDHQVCSDRNYLVFRVPSTSTMTRRSGARHAISALLDLLLLHWVPVIGSALPLPSVQIFPASTPWVIR